MCLYLFNWTTFQILGQKFIKYLRCFFGKLKTPKVILRLTDLQVGCQKSPQTYQRNLSTTPYIHLLETETSFQGVVIEFYLLIPVEKMCLHYIFILYPVQNILHFNSRQFSLYFSFGLLLFSLLKSRVESIVIYRAVVGFSNPGERG